MKNFKLIYLLIFVTLLYLQSVSHADQENKAMIEKDICINGCTTSGIMSAVTASKHGQDVVIIEPSCWQGGVVGGGIRVARDCTYPNNVGGLTKAILNTEISINIKYPHQGQKELRD